GGEAGGDGKNTGLLQRLAGGGPRVRGDHYRKGGREARLYRASGNRFNLSTSPDLNFNSNFTRGPLDNSATAPVGQELAAMLLGIPAGSMGFSASYAAQDKYFGLYLHDDFKVTRKLTVNIGARYELETPLTERFDRLDAGF